jgi:phosphoglycolate phosphatase
MSTIVFDWDGTLLDSMDALYQANVAVMDAFGLPFDETLYRRHFAADWRVFYGRLGVAEDMLEEADRLWLAAFDGGRNARLLPGVTDALRALTAAGHRLGLVTAGHRSIVAPQLDRHGLRDLFGALVFGDDLPVQKPDPAPLRVALDRLGAPSTSDAGYLGDTRDDMRMARAADVHAVGVASLLGEPAALREGGAEAVADSVAAWAQRFLREGWHEDPRHTNVGRGVVDGFAAENSAAS